jgi:thiaminase
MQEQLLSRLVMTSLTIPADDVGPRNTTLDYTSYLSRISYSGNFSEIVSVLAPCP